MNTYRLLLITLSLAIAPLTTTQGLTLKIATLAPAGTTWMKEMKKGASEIKSKTSGRVKFKFYPGGVMGSDASVHRKIRINQLQGGAFSASGLSNIDSAIQLYSLPMLFDNFDEVDHVRRVLDDKIKQAMAQKGFIILGITEGGFGRILSSKSVNSLETLRQSKVWIPEGDDLAQITMQALDIQPIALPIADVFTGLQTGLLETITATSTGAIAFQWHTRVSYVIEQPVMYVIGTLAISEKAFNKIKADDRRIVIDEMNRVFGKLSEINRRDNIDATAALVTQGIENVSAQPTEIRRWRELSLQAISRMVETGELDAKLYGELTSLLEEARQ